MQVKDVMTPNVIAVRPNESILKAAQLMLQNRISGLPVVDKDGKLVGIVTEGDFLRRVELGAQRRRPRWLEFIVGARRLGDEYVRTAGRQVEEVMTPYPLTVEENESLLTVVELMERRHVKRLPVVRLGRLVGIVSRANLVHALASLAPDYEAAPGSSTPGPDSAIRGELLATLGQQYWAPDTNVAVKDGDVELSGMITDERERQEAGPIAASPATEIRISAHG